MPRLFSLPTQKRVVWLLMTCLIFGLGTSSAQAQSHVGLYPNIPWNNNSQPCWDAAATYHHVDPWLLYAIAKVESGYNPYAVNKANRNGTVDTGLMQINSIHWPTLRRYGIEPSALTNACASTFIGAWILAQNQRRYGNSWQAIAAYNVGSLNTPKRTQIGYAYASKVYKTYELLSQARRQGAGAVYSMR